jgi:hypothetical protein
MRSSAPIAIMTPAPSSPPANHATFAGVVRGEFLKIRGLFWVMAGLLVAGFVVAFLFGASAPKGKADLQQAPLRFAYGAVESNLVVFRILAGILLIIGFRHGDPCLEARGGSAVSCLCAILSAYRRACGNRRLWSGGDTQVANARVRLVRLADSAVSSPGIPCL